MRPTLPQLPESCEPQKAHATIRNSSVTERHTDFAVPVRPAARKLSCCAVLAAQDIVNHRDSSHEYVSTLGVSGCGPAGDVGRQQPLVLGLRHDAGAGAAESAVRLRFCQAAG